MDHLEIVAISLGILLIVSVLLSVMAISSFCFILVIQITIRILYIIAWIFCLPGHLINCFLSGRDETNWDNVDENTALLTHLDNRANQFNPNNNNYWRSRGSSSRSSAWADEVNERNLRGQYEYLANSEASTSHDQKRKMGI